MVTPDEIKNIEKEIENTVRKYKRVVVFNTTVIFITLYFFSTTLLVSANLRLTRST